MKILRKLLSFTALILFAMLFTSCKAIIGEGEITVKYAIATTIIALVSFILDALVCISAEKHGKGVGWAFLDMIIILVPFFWRPFTYFNLLVLGISLVLFFIGLGVSGNKTLKDNAASEAKAKVEAEEKEKEEAEKKAQEEEKARIEAEEAAKAKAEAEAKAAAEAKAKEEAIEAAKKKLADEKAAKLAETQATLSQLENDLAAKKAEVASLGMDAQGIVQKAKLNKEIKELEPQIETLKAEVERLSK